MGSANAIFKTAVQIESHLKASDNELRERYSFHKNSWNYVFIQAFIGHK